MQGSCQACMVFGYQGGLPANRAERPVRLQDKWVTYVLQISAQWACYFASASNEMTLYYCRRQRIITQHLGLGAEMSFLICPHFSLGS